MGSIRRSLPKVKTKKKKIQKNLYSLYVQYIFVMEFCIQSIFAKPPCHTAAAEKKLLLFSVSLTLSFLFSNQPNFLAVKKKTLTSY